MAIGRWAATVPALTVPAAISTSCVATATSPPGSMESIGSPMASASADSDGPKTVGDVAEAPDVELRRVAAEAHQLEQHLGRVARRHVGELVDLQQIEAALPSTAARAGALPR